MKRVYSLLTVLLVVQLALAFGLFWSGRQGGDRGEVRVLLAASAQAVDRISIADAASEVILEDSDGMWRLPQAAGLPADNQKVAGLIDSLSRVSVTWPVTDTPGSHQRFEVAEQKFQRRVKLYHAGELLAEFYLGTSPGYRQVHLRPAGEDAVYAVTLSVNDMPVSNDAWLDSTLLAVSGPTRIEGGDYVLVTAGDDSWQLQYSGDADPAPPGELDSDRAGQLVSALSSLRVQASADSSVAPDDDSAEVRTLRVATADGQFEYRFFALAGRHYVQRDDLDGLFVVSQYDYDRIAGVDYPGLLAGQEESTAAEAEPEPEPELDRP